MHIKPTKSEKAFDNLWACYVDGRLNTDTDYVYPTLLIMTQETAAISQLDSADWADSVELVPQELQRVPCKEFVDILALQAS